MAEDTRTEHKPPVSFPDEQLILVDESDAVVGYASKEQAHRGEGRLHRAFSIFLFDDAGRVLLHRRSIHKPLWPGFWTNSCCSHPRRGESYRTASQRRLREELGVSASLEWLYQFQYSARFGDIGSERELCAVLIGFYDGAQRLQPHQREIDEWGWFDAATVDAWVEARPEAFTPWFLQEWSCLRGDLRDRVDRCLRSLQDTRAPAYALSAAAGG